jgi:hypothetical protein
MNRVLPLRPVVDAEGAVMDTPVTMNLIAAYAMNTRARGLNG